MKKILSVAVLGFAVVNSPAMAQEPKILGCFKKVLMPAQYNVTKKLIKDAERKYIKRGETYTLVEYPPVYEEEKTLVKEAYYVMKEVACK